MTYTPAVRDGKADPDVQPREEKVLTLGTYGRMDFYQFKERGDAAGCPVHPRRHLRADENNPSYHPAAAPSSPPTGGRSACWAKFTPPSARI